MKKIETELEYMKTYSKWRHMIMCGYDEQGLKDEMDELHCLFQDYQFEHPDCPTDSDIPWWHSLEARDMWASMVKPHPPIELCWIIHGVDEMYTGCNEKFNQKINLFPEKDFKEDMIEMIDAFYEDSLHKVKTMLGLSNEDAWMYLSISKKCREGLSKENIELMESLCAKYLEIYKKDII